MHPDIIEDSKYYTWYWNIINTAREQGRTGYVEKHHILPRKMGGTNKPDNLVKLSAREHFIVHRLLTKFTIGNSNFQMMFAFNWMCNRFQELRNDRDYERFRINISSLVSEMNTGRHIGAGSPNYDHTNYHFYNHWRNETFYGTQWELRQHDPSISAPETVRIVKQPDKMSKGWMIYDGRTIPTPYDPSFNYSTRDLTIFNWHNKQTGDTFVGTRYDLEHTFPSYRMTKPGICDVIKGRTKSHRGWVIV